MDQQLTPGQLDALKTNNMPQPDTYATYGDAIKAAYDTAPVERVQGIVDDAWSKAEKLAANERLTPQAKAEDINQLIREAQDNLASVAEETLTSIIEQIPKARAAMQRPLSVKPEEAAALNYLRDTLAAQVQAHALNYGDVIRLWKQALDTKDLPALRVFHDNGASLLAATDVGRAGGTDGNRRAVTGPQVDELRRLSDVALRTPEQTAAAAKLLRLEATRIQLLNATNAAKSKLKRPALQGNKIVDRAEVERREAFRRMF